MLTPVHYYSLCVADQIIGAVLLTS